MTTQTTIYHRLYRAIKEHAELEDDAIRDAGTHGADTGWGGFIYTGDCVQFYEANKGDIWELAREMADDLGHKNVPEMVANFNRSEMADDPDGFANLLAWFALEEVGRWLEDNPEQGDDYQADDS